MTHEQLIAKAREHAAAYERGVPFAARVSDFEKVTVRETVIVRFENGNRGDHIKIYLDRETGDF
ncbi:MAG: hypothetical protein AB1705_27455 [Verrucomicrobiota bacterium]